MTELVPVTDHTEQALGLLIGQYQDLPRMSGLVSAHTNRAQELEDITWDVINKRLLDYTDRNGNPAHAVGAQLDAIGRLVGRGRHGQDDATYLIYIRAQIYLNKSQGLRDQVIGLMTLVQSADFTYTEYYPGVVYLEFTEPTQTASPLAASPAVLLDLAQRAVSGGVRVYLVMPGTSGAANSFAFSNFGAANAHSRGFGQLGSMAYGGKLASEYT